MPLELVYPADLLEGVMKQVKPPVVLTQVGVACISSVLPFPSPRRCEP